MKISVEAGSADGETVSKKLRDLAADYDPWYAALRSRRFWAGVALGVGASALVNVTDLHIRVCWASKCGATVIDR
jgi:hypothetical protein